VTQFLLVGEGGWLTAHQPTKNQAMLPSLSGRRGRGGDNDFGGNSDGGGTGNNQQSTKIGGGNGDGNGNDDSNDDK
jgi:hypothetical protein